MNNSNDTGKIEKKRKEKRVRNPIVRSECHTTLMRRVSKYAQQSCKMSEDTLISLLCNWQSAHTDSDIKSFSRHCLIAWVHNSGITRVCVWCGVVRRANRERTKNECFMPCDMMMVYEVFEAPTHCVILTFEIKRIKIRRKKKPSGWNGKWERNNW